VAQLDIRDTPPDPADPAWRADCLARAQHTRLVGPLDPPAAAPVRDAGGQRGAGQKGAEAEAPARDAGGRRTAGPGAAGDGADGLCAALTRDLLGDFAPALLLLPATERSRARALIACARLLFDFARQPGPEGERLAGLARCEHGLEQALAGRAVGQPILLRVGEESSRRRWPPDALDELLACARRRALRPHGGDDDGDGAAVEAEQRSLARAVGTALLEERINSEVTGFAAALMRLCGVRGAGVDPEAARRACIRLRPRLLRAPRGLVELPAPYRRAGVFCLLVALRIVSQIEESGSGRPAAPARLNAGTRIGMLLRARWFRWSGR
jgi:hypothetical protein